MKKLLFLFLLLFNAAGLFSQQTYFIKDQFTLESVPFSKISPSEGAPFLADIDGAFHVESSVTQVQIRTSGFRDTLVLLSQVENGTILIQPTIQNIQEVVATAGENPAHRIIDLAIANRKRNNPMENDAFHYESYSKFIFDVNKEELDAIPDNSSDTNLIKLRRFFDEQHLFLLESASTRSFMPPARDKEVITAYKVSGFSDPMFSTFANEMQSFTFYENQVQLLGKNYINPIALGGTNRYLFILKDTTIVNQDTTFTIFYRPRKGKNFDGMTGELYINTNGYAIEKVTASPYSDTVATKVQIVQEYAFTSNKKWFPSKLSTEIIFSGISLNPKLKNTFIQGKGSTYVKGVSFDTEGIRKREFDNVSVVVSEDAADLKDSEWDKLRKYEMTEKERRTYTMIDSLSEAHNLNQRLTTLKVLTEGKVPLGYANLDLNRVVNFNQYEGYRFGVGLETSRKLMKPVVLGGYIGWATKDKEWKYGGYSTIHLFRKRGVKLDIRYQQDLVDRGGPGFQKSGFSLVGTELYRNFYQTYMERQRLAEIALTGYVKANIKVVLSGSFQRIEYTKDYSHFTTNSFWLTTASTGTDLAEAAAELTWNIREQVMLVGDQRVSKGTNYPKIRIRVAKGLPEVFTANQDYWRLNFEIQQDIPLLALGSFSWCLAAGQTIGDVPLFLQQQGNGTGRNWNLSVRNTFETMVPGEFYNAKQVALYNRLDFTKFKTKANWNEPQICLHHAIGFGEMDDKTGHSTTFRSMDKGFYEGGLIVNNILVSSFMGLGVGGFYRYGYYSNSGWSKNIVPKLTVTFNL